MRKREDEREETEKDHHLIKLTSHNYTIRGEGGEGGRKKEIKQKEKKVKIIKIMINCKR